LLRKELLRFKLHKCVSHKTLRYKKVHPRGGLLSSIKLTFKIENDFYEPKNLQLINNTNLNIDLETLVKIQNNLKSK